MRRTSLASLALLGLVLLASAGCNRTPADAGQAQNAPPAENPPAAADGLGSGGGSPAPTKTQSGKPPTTPTNTWPSPEYCISYNPTKITAAYGGGMWSVNEGNKNVALAPGGPSDNVGDKLLALAKRYKKHCLIGHNNQREEKNSFIFDYWRDSSGMNPTIADQDEDCSPYNRNNLTVENMGSGHGWRVKDHDHVLHVFDNETDARNGKLVLAKYGKICFIGNSSDDDQNQVSYSL
jgi:hypothetical protein